MRQVYMSIKVSLDCIWLNLLWLIIFYIVEPMTLGSPLNSPGHVSPAIHQGAHGSQFLPGFLMGDATTPTVSRRPGVPYATSRKSWAL